MGKVLYSLLLTAALLLGLSACAMDEYDEAGNIVGTAASPERIQASKREHFKINNYLNSGKTIYCYGYEPGDSSYSWAACDYRPYNDPDYVQPELKAKELKVGDDFSYWTMADPTQKDKEVVCVGYELGNSKWSWGSCNFEGPDRREAWGK